MISAHEKFWLGLGKVATTLGTSVFGLIEILIVMAVLLNSTPTMTSLAVGCAIAIIGLVVRLWAVGYGAKSGMIALGGPYLFVRHPFFMGTVLFYLGLCFAGRSIEVTLGSLVLLVYIINRNLKLEENKMSQLLGSEFGSYQASVPPFFPRILPFNALKRVSAPITLKSSLVKHGQGELFSVVLLGLVLLCLYASTLPMANEWYQIAVVTSAVLFFSMKFLFFKKYHQHK